MKFEKTELIHLAISILTITFAFYILLAKGSGTRVSLFTVFLTVGAAFVVHELAHKAVAQNFGCIAVYRAWITGLLLALGFAVLTPFIFAAPGAVYIHKEFLSIKENGIISLAGPAVNIVLGMFFLLLLFNTGLSMIGLWGFKINMFLALFNMLPFPPLDGSKVVKWSPFIWGAVFFPLIYLNFFFGI